MPKLAKILLACLLCQVVAGSLIWLIRKLAA